MSRPAYSSLNGGHMIYIKAIGHDLMASGNQIYVGSFPCIIPADGVTDTFISCETSDSGSKVDIMNLKVTLISFGIQTISSSVDIVHYMDSRTPILSEVFPSSGFGEQTIYYNGIPRSISFGNGRDFGDILGLKVGY